MKVVAAAWVEVRDGRLLAVRARGRDRWFVPGGKPEPGEDPADTVVREVREELGLELQPGTLRLLGVVTTPAHGYPAGTEVHLHCFAGAAEGEPLARAEIDEVGWLGPADVGVMAPGCRAVYEAFVRGRATPGLGVPPLSSMTFHVLVEVRQRPGIADPQGATIERALPTLGYGEIHDVRVGKAIRLTVEAADGAEARRRVEALCHEFLTNPVIEDAVVTVEEA